MAEKSELLRDYLRARDRSLTTNAREDMDATDALLKLVLSSMAGPGEVVVQGWQPIDTAPKDGVFWCYCPTVPPQSFEQQATRVRGGRWLTSWPPTHWMPLPARPNNGGADDRV